MPRDVSREKPTPSGATWKAPETRRSNVKPASCIRSLTLRADPERVHEHEPRPLGDSATSSSIALQRGVQAVGPAALRRPMRRSRACGRGRRRCRRWRGSTLPCSRTARRRPVRETPARRDHVRDRRGLVAALGDRLDHRAVEARPLVAGDLVTVHTARPVWQPAVQRCDLAPCSTHPHCSER